MHTLTLLAPSVVVETLSDALVFELGARSVTVEDADAGSDAEQALFGEPGTVVEEAWPRSTVVALFDEAVGAQRAADRVTNESWSGDVVFVSLGTVPETDWVRATQSQFEPVPITPDFWIVPTWHEIPSQAARAIRLDPGLAFGSGTHPTTRMCLRWIARQARAVEGHRVLDYGCGSGILAIAAAMHGARAVDATDIDDAALVATRENTRVNRVRVDVGTPDRFDTRYDFVLANILATPLTVLAPVLTARLDGHGVLVMAGLLSRQVAALQEAYAPAVNLSVHDEEEDWVLLVGHRSDRSVARRDDPSTYVASSLA